MSKTEWLPAAPISATNRAADTPLFKFFNRLLRGENLPTGEAARFFRELTAEKAHPAQIAGSLVALTAKGETAEELAGMAETMRAQAVKINSRHRNLTDLAGTGASAAKIFNVSTAAAFVAAGAGLPVAKQTSHAVLSNSGSAEVLDKLGINIKIEPEIAKACLNGAGLCFLYAPKFHPHLKTVGEIRHALGIRTCLNLLGVLSNPARATRQLIGVWHPSLLEPLARAQAILETEHSWIVHGADGLDEMTLTGETIVFETFGGKIRKLKLTPEDFGLPRGKIEQLRAQTPAAAAQIINEVLNSQRRDEARSLVVINAAAALLVGGLAKEPIQAARLAEQSIDSGSARIKLERLIQTTNKVKGNR